MKFQTKTRFLAAVLAVSMAAIGSGAVFAEDDIMLIDEMPIEAPAAQETHVQADGIASEVNTEAEVPYIIMGEAMEQIHFHISDETVLIKADGTPISLADITAGSNLRVYHSPAMTRSLPPQTTALAVILIENETDLVPLYAVAGSVSQAEGSLEIKSLDGSSIFIPAPNCEVVPYKTRNIVTLSDITEGRAFLAWSEIATMSLPPIYNPSKIMVLPEAIEKEPLTGIYVNGEQIVADIKVDGDIALVPVRAISEKLGYTVTWNGADRSVTVGDLTLVLDSTTVTAATARSTNELEIAPALIEELTYVPASFFTLLTGNAANVSEGLVEINA